MIKVEIKQYLAMLSSFTECAQYKAECYRLKAENEKLRIKLSISLNAPKRASNEAASFDYSSRIGAN